MTTQMGTYKNWKMIPIKDIEPMLLDKVASTRWDNMWYSLSPEGEGDWWNFFSEKSASEESKQEGIGAQPVMAYLLTASVIISWSRKKRQGILRTLSSWNREKPERAYKVLMDFAQKYLPFFRPFFCGQYYWAFNLYDTLSIIWEGNKASSIFEGTGSYSSFSFIEEEGDDPDDVDLCENRDRYIPDNSKLFQHLSDIAENGFKQILLFAEGNPKAGSMTLGTLLDKLSEVSMLPDEPDHTAGIRAMTRILDNSGISDSCFEEDEEDGKDFLYLTWRDWVDAHPEMSEFGQSSSDDPQTTEEILEALSGYHLGKRTLRELEQLIELLRHARAGELVSRVRYSLLLQCDQAEYGMDFLYTLTRLLLNAGLLDAWPDIIDEGDNYENNRGGLSFLRVVKNCKPAPTIDSSAISSERADSREALKKWEKFWSNEETFLKGHTNAIGVAIVSKNTIRSSWKDRHHLFHRVYAHHIFLDDIPPEDIYSMLYDKLYELDLLDDGQQTAEFTEALREYINIVYPKADLKYKEFVSDTVNRILTVYYSVAEPEPMLTLRCIPYYRKPQSFEDIISRLDDMVGMDTVKTEFEELYYQSKSRADSKTPLRLHMAFTGNPGTGKTTVAQMTADFLYSMGLIPSNKLTMTKSSDFISPYVGQTAHQTLEICRKAYGGVLFIDEAYTLSYSRNESNTDKVIAQCVDTLLLEMENNADQLVVIFAGYPEEMNRFLDSNEGFRSRINKIIRFRDYTDIELLEIFERICGKEMFYIEEEAYPALIKRISFEKSTKGFGNARSMEKIFKSIQAEWTKSGDELRIITEEHIQATMPEERSSDISDMIGLDDIKEQIEKFEHLVKYLHILEEKGSHVPPTNLHMLFTGNPGTGKTTVARRIADDLYKIGILKTNRCVCVEARDLMSGLVSNSSKRTEEKIREAMGGVLFLDEAYALTEVSGAVGQEVIATLITAMEEHRGEFVVILAGYPNSMDRFMNVNPGLRSRIGYTFHFRDYTVEELTKIFLAKMQKYGFILSEGVADKVKEIMEYFHVIPDFGNGRFVDNVIDQTINCRAMRADDDLSHYNEITVEDIPCTKLLLDGMPDGYRFRDPAKVTQEEKRRTAVHEVGHALVSLILEPELEISTVSISAQAYSSGRVEMQRSGGNLTDRQLMAMIATALGGRGAERVVFGDHTTGCSSDYAMAKSIATDMLETFAMGTELEDHDTASLLNFCNETVMKLLESNKEELLELSDKLLEQQELTDKEMREYLQSRSAEEPESGSESEEETAEQ